MSVNVHSANKIFLSPIQEYNGSIWRTLTICTTDGVVRIDIFPEGHDQSKLTVVETPNQ